jgi:hypothetical protein
MTDKELIAWAEGVCAHTKMDAHTFKMIKLLGSRLARRSKKARAQNKELSRFQRMWDAGVQW